MSLQEKLSDPEAEQEPQRLTVSRNPMLRARNPSAPV